VVSLRLTRLGPITPPKLVDKHFEKLREELRRFAPDIVPVPGRDLPVDIEELRKRLHQLR